jgi:hypothetical protein
MGLLGEFFAFLRSEKKYWLLPLVLLLLLVGLLIFLLEATSVFWFVYPLF